MGCKVDSVGPAIEPKYDQGTRLSASGLTAASECFRTPFVPQISHQYVAPPGPGEPGQGRTGCVSGDVLTSLCSSSKLKFYGALLTCNTSRPT